MINISVFDLMACSCRAASFGRLGTTATAPNSVARGAVITSGLWGKNAARSNDDIFGKGTVFIPPSKRSWSLHCIAGRLDCLAPSTTCPVEGEQSAQDMSRSRTKHILHARRGPPQWHLYALWHDSMTADINQNDSGITCLLPGLLLPAVVCCCFPLQTSSGRQVAVLLVCPLLNHTRATPCQVPQPTYRMQEPLSAGATSQVQAPEAAPLLGGNREWGQVTYLRSAMAYYGPGPSISCHSGGITDRNLVKA